MDTPFSFSGIKHNTLLALPVNAARVLKTVVGNSALNR
jgi:hypothetical protein